MLRRVRSQVKTNRVRGFLLTFVNVRGVIVQEANMAEQALNEQTESPEQVAGQRNRSTMQFAYLPLDDAVTVANAVHAVGASCQLDQLAAELKVKTDTGSFRLKVSNAKLFGVITHTQGTVTLTNLGSRMCDPQQEQGAKAEAFLNVPLYKQVYEQFKGITLPPNSGLETVMVTMGVAPKQKSVARQVFARSAQQAGFFKYGTNRLVPPSAMAAAGAAVIPEGATTTGQETQNDK